MKNITAKKFYDRTQAVARARKIFIDSGLTKNITTAFVLYQEILAEQDMPIFLSAPVYGAGSRSALNIPGRPKCPQCGLGMGLRPVNIPQGPKNAHGWRSCWECTKCGYEEYSQKSIDEWLGDQGDGKA